MADKRVIDLTEKSTVDTSDFLMIDNSSGGTKKLQIATLLGAIDKLKKEVVQTLPTQDIDTNTIYLVPKQTAGTQNVYDEYMYINNAWEIIGDTEVDLSGYQTKTDNSLNTTSKQVVGAINELLTKLNYVQISSSGVLPNNYGYLPRFDVTVRLTIDGQSISFVISDIGFGEAQPVRVFDSLMILVADDTPTLDVELGETLAFFMYYPDKFGTVSLEITSIVVGDHAKRATLAAGATTVTFTGVPTTGEHLIELYTSKAGLDYTAVDDTTSGELTYTFEAQSAAVTVYLVIREVS